MRDFFKRNWLFTLIFAILTFGSLFYIWYDKPDDKGVYIAFSLIAAVIWAIYFVFWITKPKPPTKYPKG